MWTFTPIGFFSIVSHPQNRDQVMIRARDKHHLLALCLASSKVLDRAWIESSLLYQPQSDYLWRIIVSQDEMVAVFADLLSNIDYSNFKDRASSSRDLSRWGKAAQSKYVDSLHKVWSVMYRLQDALNLPKPATAIKRCPHGDAWSPVCYDCESIEGDAV